MLQTNPVHNERQPLGVMMMRSRYERAYGVNLKPVVKEEIQERVLTQEEIEAIELEEALMQSKQEAPLQESPLEQGSSSTLFSLFGRVAHSVRSALSTSQEISSEKKDVVDETISPPLTKAASDDVSEGSYGNMMLFGLGALGVMAAVGTTTYLGRQSALEDTQEQKGIEGLELDSMRESLKSNKAALEVEVDKESEIQTSMSI